MPAPLVVQLDNATPTILSLEKCGTRGIRGSVGLSRCTKRSPKADIRSVGAALRISAMTDRVEVPAWMFEPTACDHLHLTTTPFVDCQALIELKTVLQTTPRA